MDVMNEKLLKRECEVKLSLDKIGTKQQRLIY